MKYENQALYPAEAHSCSGRSWTERQSCKETVTLENIHAKTHKLHPGSLVSVRNPVHVKNGKSKFSEPLKVTQQRVSYTLTDGKTWDASLLSVLPETFTLPAEEQGPTEPATSNSVRDRSQRNRKQPAWIKDYVSWEYTWGTRKKTVLLIVIGEVTPRLSLQNIFSFLKAFCCYPTRGKCCVLKASTIAGH